MSRVDLRPATPRDAARLLRWRSEASVRRYQPLTELSLGQLRADISRQRIADLRRGSGEKFQWIVGIDGEPAGWITLVVANWDHGLCEVGYALSTEFQNRGLMAQALGMLIDEVFRDTPLKRIEARCAVGNIASQRVLAKAGFAREGLLRSFFELRGERVDNYLYAILSSDGSREH